MRHDCKYKNMCEEKVVMEMFLRFGGRSQGLLPNCDICNSYQRKEGDEIATHSNQPCNEKVC